MPVTGLPNMLEQMMNSILVDNNVQSWQIKGYDGHTHVILKFKMVDMEDQGKNIVYKRKPKSQTLRDYGRANAWRTQNIMKTDGYMGENEMIEIQQSPCDIDNTETAHENQQVQHQGVSHDLLITTETCDHIAQPNSQTDMLSNPNTNMGNTPVDQESINTLNSDLNRVSVSSVHSANTSSETGSEVNEGADSVTGGNMSLNHDFISKYGELLQCDECHVPIPELSGIEWMRCTHCTDVNLCNACWSSGKHKVHHHQMHSYTWQSKQNDKPLLSCDSCGFLYNEFNPNFRVYQCLDCEDFTMCRRCYNEDMHEHHKQHIKERLLSFARKSI